MMRLGEFLEALAEVRTNEVVVTAMGAAREWPQYSDCALDLNYIPSSMGQGQSLGLGLALAKPSRRVLVVNGDGCLLMNLGSLVTIGECAPRNYVLFNMENGIYGFTGGQPLAGAGRGSFAGLARSAGWPVVREYEEIGACREELGGVLGLDGPVFVNLKIVPEPGGSFRRLRPIGEDISLLKEALGETR